MDIISKIDEFKDEIIKIRRHIHEYPDLSGEEKARRDFLKLILENASIKCKTFENHYALVCDIIVDEKAPFVAFRADMDALPIKEENNKPYASKKDGVMHACGHDGHCAILAGVMLFLNKHKHLLKKNIRAIFQHKEEVFEGGSVYDEYNGEVSAVVVLPEYKGRGIMNKMFVYLLNKAKNLGLKAVYGEAIMFHPFSQKANLKQSMIESALQLGEVASWLSQKDIKFQKRFVTLVSFKLFSNEKRFVNFPKVYKRIIKDVYKRAAIKTYRYQKKLKPSLCYQTNELLNIAIIVIDSKIANFR